MNLKFSKIRDRKKSIVDMFLYGLIGYKDEETGRYLDGHEFAKEVRWLGKNYDQINVHLNCEGGSVGQGLSITASFADVDAKIVTINDGICASMGTMVLMNGDEVEVKDYSKTMFHMAYLVDEKGKVIKKLSTKQQEGLNMANDTLFRLVKKRGKNDDEAKEIITPADKWFTPEDLMESGLVDRIIDTGKKKELAALEPMRLVAKINNEHNSKSMKKVIAKLNGFGLDIAEDANEDQVVAALNGFEVPKADEPSEKLVNLLIALGVKTGVVTKGDDGNEAKFRKLAAADMELFVDMLGVEKMEIKAPHGGSRERMSDLVNQAKKTKKPVDDEKDFAWFEKNDPEALAKMENLEPEKFEKLMAADKAKYE